MVALKPTRFKTKCFVNRNLFCLEGHEFTSILYCQVLLLLLLLLLLLSLSLSLSLLLLLTDGDGDGVNRQMESLWALPLGPLLANVFICSIEGNLEQHGLIENFWGNF